MRLCFSLIFIITSICSLAQMNANKKAVLATVDKHQQELINLSDSIWKYAETALKKYKSSKALSDLCSEARFSR